MDIVLKCVVACAGGGRPVARADRAVQPAVARLRGEAARVQGAAREAGRRRGKDLKVLNTASYFFRFHYFFVILLGVILWRIVKSSRDSYKIMCGKI